MKKINQIKLENNSTGEMVRKQQSSENFKGYNCRYSDLESRMKDELMSVKIKFTEQSARLAELKQEVSRLETKVGE